LPAAPWRTSRDDHPQDVKSRQDEIVSESGAVSANRALAALSSFYAWAIDKEHHTGANPTADIKPLKETGRKRVLSKTELVQIWPACENDDHGRIIKLLINAAERRCPTGPSTTPLAQRRDAMSAN
jgi:integrase